MEMGLYKRDVTIGFTGKSACSLSFYVYGFRNILISNIPNHNYELSHPPASS